MMRVHMVYVSLCSPEWAQPCEMQEEVHAISSPVPPKQWGFGWGHLYLELRPGQVKKPLNSPLCNTVFKRVTLLCVTTE